MFLDMSDKAWRGERMKGNKKKYIILICVLFLAAYLAERFMLLHMDELQGKSIISGGLLEIYPIYNDSGSWFHGKLGIDYARPLLIFEDILSLILEVFLLRYIAAMCDFFSMSRKILMVVACGMPATAFRLFTRIRGLYVLDYLHLKGHGVFDLPDLYLFIAVAGLFIWIVPLLKVYYPYKNKKVKGMSVLQKWAWEFRFAGTFLKAAFVPRDSWEELFQRWR